MKGVTMGKNTDAALSEVIGFVLLIGILVLVFSLYLTYGVPAQGRESEITHMNEIKDQFITYKIGLDSLYTNDKLNTPVSDSFTLGTSGGHTQGSISIIPLLSPIQSSGTMAINQRTTEPETLMITSQSLVLNTTNQTSVDFPPVKIVDYSPNHLYVNISGIQASNLNQNGIFGTTITGNSWTAIVNLTPQGSYFQTYSLNGNDLIPGTPEYNYTGTDLQISIMKNNVMSVQNYPVYKNIKSGTTYVVDLFDESYGLRSSILPSTSVNLNTDKPLGSVLALGNISYGFSEESSYSIDPLPLGSLEYRGQNNYWIAQNYYYQLGGIFLTQAEGNTTSKLPPEISFAYSNSSDPSKTVVTISVNALVFSPDNQGIVGGNTPVQIKTTLMSIAPYPYVDGVANTKWVRLAINTTDTKSRLMWKEYFCNSAKSAGIPDADYSCDIEGNEAYIRMNGDDDPYGTGYPTRYDIRLIATNATYDVRVRGVGGAL